MRTSERGIAARGRRRGRPRRLLAGALVVGAVAATLGPAAVAAAATPQRGTGGAPPRIIVDTDLSRWWDDATAIGMANVLEQRGKVRILGIVSDVRNPVAVSAIDAIDTAYGHASIPLGAVVGTAANTAPHGYSDALAVAIPHRIRSGDTVPGAVALYRRLLAAQPDHSVTIVSIGGYTNLAGLLASPGGRALIGRKVKQTVIEDGLFPNGGPPFTNEALDLPAADQVVGGAGWPTPIAWVDGLTGIQTRVGASLCTTTPPTNPMHVVYQTLFRCGPPGDGDWDGPTLLFAVGGPQGEFTELGQGGAAALNAQGGLSWAPSATRHDDVYVHVANQAALNQQINTLLVAR